VLAISLSPWRIALDIAAAIAMMMIGMSSLLAPMIVQGRLRETLDLLDIFKSSPLRGWQIALGQLLTPAVLALLFQWSGLLLIWICILVGGYAEYGRNALTWSGLFGVALLAPLLSALMMCIPFAWILWFPAWAQSLGTRGGGFEAAGQRMLFSLAYLVLTVVALAPALLLGALVAWLVGMGLGMAIGLAFGAVLAAAVLVVELGLVLRGLGWKIDRFDLSTELR
jgi:hypothetical protein